ncbi:DUF3825 domain-containing protein [Actinocorallia sp. A-T 12471]|uniref:DUF3825 domain-containing protein n=1 Tax=Actinocorallia sp. A-T 12471 TaxID=3089813 RepID=UPI0029CBFD65|nr:DUF3825 domain-containing protein [Actinocorallia sp. A-T 12471]MDX6743685.1 DUF3825 domain-containing protein [Actinocorallia sp. A-T 12471]
MTLHESKPSFAEGRGFPDFGRLVGDPPSAAATRPARPARALYEQVELGPLRIDGTTTEDCFDRLARLAAPEPWTAPGRDGTWLLREYLEQTFERLHAQRRIAVAADGSRSLFDTGLTTADDSVIYALCLPGANPDGAPWALQSWVVEDDPRVADRFPDRPGRAEFTADPAELVFDWRLPLTAHPRSLLDNRESVAVLPAELRTNPYLAGLVMEGAIRRAETRAHRDPRSPVPAWDATAEKVSLLLPLALSSPDTADVALVVAQEPSAYRAVSILALDVARSRARLLSRRTDWLAAPVEG